MDISFEDNVFKLSMSADDSLGPIRIFQQSANGDIAEASINLQTLVDLPTLSESKTLEFTITLSAATMSKFAREAKWWASVSKKAKA